MKALVLKEYNNLVVEDVPKPTAQAGEVLVRIKSSAICGSDAHGVDGSTGRRIPPIVMGHEASGEIAEIGEGVTAWKVGDRVTFDSTIFRLDDWFTRRGWYNLSDGRKVLGVSCDEYRRNGTFAEYVVIPQHILYRLPDSLSFDAAAITVPLAVAMHAVSLTPISQGDTVAVIGAGVIGLMVVASLVKSGCANIVVSDISDKRLELARACGATHTVNPTESSLVDVCSGLTDGRGADAILEAVGHEKTIQDAISAVRRGGTVTVIGNLSKQVNIPLQRIVAGQIRIQGSCAIREEFPAALALLDSGKIPLDLIISETGTLEEAPQLFARLMKGDPQLIKVVLHP
jgi:L-iditol 2-dehydrogenase